MNMNKALHMVNHWLKGAPMVEHELMDAVRYIVSEVELEWGPPPQGYDPEQDHDDTPCLDDSFHRHEMDVD